jgi:hypothetical protein
MRVTSKEDRAKYVSQKIEQGYSRVNKWCPAEHRNTVNAIIDILCCHQEDPTSTIDFHEFINIIVENIERYNREYEVKNDNAV